MKGVQKGVRKWVQIEGSRFCTDPEPEGQLNAVSYFMLSGYNAKIPENIIGHIAKHNEDSEDGIEFFIAFIGLTAQKQNESIQSLKQATKKSSIRTKILDKYAI